MDKDYLLLDYGLNSSNVCFSKADKGSFLYLVGQKTPAEKVTFFFDELGDEWVQLIQEELNVRHVEVLPADRTPLKPKISPNFLVLREKNPSLIKKAQELLRQTGYIAGHTVDGYVFQVEDTLISFEPCTLEDYESFVTSYGNTVILDNRWSAYGFVSGFQRAFSTTVNTLRKEAGLSFGDKVSMITWSFPQNYWPTLAMRLCKKALCEETLAQNCCFELPGPGFLAERIFSDGWVRIYG